jgi:hypothetical protein
MINAQDGKIVQHFRVCNLLTEHVVRSDELPPLEEEIVPPLTTEDTRERREPGIEAKAPAGTVTARVNQNFTGYLSPLRMCCEHMCAVPCLFLSLSR